jgi:peptidoglycan hydrolase CwlO-like protein
MEQQFYTILITLITVLSSTAAWKFYERRLSLKAKKDEDSTMDGRLFRDDLRDRVVKLETLLTESSKEKDKMRENIVSLTSQVSRLEVEVEFLRKDNESLRSENNLLRTTYRI